MSAFSFVETLAIGDELLTGKISDTNSAHVASQLFALGIRLHRSTVVADDEGEIVDALAAIARRSPVCVVFGGLGPTSDDKTAETICRMIGGELVMHEPSKEKLIRFFGERKREVTETALKQVHYPSKCEPLRNPDGLAPAFTMEWKSCRFFFLPGVPTEMKAIWKESVLPRVQAIHQKLGGPKLLHHGWRLIGIGESQVQQLMTPIEKDLPKGAYIGYRTHFPENHLVLYVGSEVENAAECLEKFRLRITAAVAPFTYSERDKELEALVFERLAEKNLTLAMAESCTGGAAAYRMTKMPGVSRVFWGSEVVYQLDAKNACLGLGLTEEGQTVSATTTKALAEALKIKSNASVVAAVTGYLGPEGGTPEIPRGTIFVHVIAPSGVSEKKIFLIARDRDRGQWGAATHLFHEILNLLEK